MARSLGANACLLIAAALPCDDQFHQLITEITTLGMDPVVEVFTADELQRSLQFNPSIIQINKNL